MRRVTKITELLASAKRTAETYYSSTVNVGRYHEAEVFVDVTAETATATLDVTIQTSPDGTTWFTHTSFDQITATGQSVKRISIIGHYLRVKYVVAGEGADFTFSSDIVAKS